MYSRLKDAQTKQREAIKTIVSIHAAQLDTCNVVAHSKSTCMVD